MPRAFASSATLNFSAFPPPDLGLKIRTGCLGAAAGDEVRALGHGHPGKGAGDHEAANHQGDLGHAFVEEQQDRGGERDRRRRNGRRF